MFSVLFVSEDLTEVHLFAHGAYGEPRDSGRAEMMEVTVTVLYLCHLMEWFGTSPEISTAIYCDNEEAVSFANHRWLGSTPKWADTRNIYLKLILSQQLEKWDKCIRIEHVKGHQDKGIEYEANAPACKTERDL